MTPALWLDSCLTCNWDQRWRICKPPCHAVDLIASELLFSDVCERPFNNCGLRMIRRPDAALYEPYQTSLPPSRLPLCPPSLRNDTSMNRSWHWQLQQYHNKLLLLDTRYNAEQQQPSSATTTMDPTTLVTFLFKAPPEARAVELLGSWDNFAQPYPMHHDRRRGTGLWSGCFKFHNIIFDGDSSYWTKPRTGGLKQGGTYWYYYRLNDEVEAYDDAQDYTTTCPLLPGQPVNVIEVPVELLDPPTRSRSASLNVAGTIANLPSTHTLDPGDKFNALEPPPVSRVHGRCVSDLELSGRLETKAQSFKEATTSLPGSPCSQHERTNSPTSGPVERYYAAGGYTYDAYPEDGSSLYSGRSMRSAAPSVAHSSVIDAYGADSTAFDVDSYELSPILEVSSPTMDPATSIPYEHCDELDIRSQHAPARYNGESWTFDDYLETSSIAPASISDVQFFSSRPTTSHSGTPACPRVFYLTNDDFHTANSDLDSGFEVSARQSAEQRCDSEHDSHDIMSPTYSAATISSGGASTPFRLSVGCSRSTSAYAHNDDSIEGVAERLRSLAADDDPMRSPIYEQDEPTFGAYSLPQSAATFSAQSLGKLIAHDFPLPSPRQEKQEDSFADAIFSELGFLGRSIC